MKEFLKLIVKLSDDEVYEKNLDEDLRIDKNNMSQEIMQQAGKFAWWATLSELAKDKAARAKRELEISEAMLSKHYRETMIAAGEKPTEKSVDNAVKLDESYTAMKDACMEATKQAGILEVARESFDQRKWMLRALSVEQGAGMDMGILRNLVEDVIKSSKNS